METEKPVMLYDVEVNSLIVARSVGEDEAWRIVTLGHIGQLHRVFYAGTTDIAEDFVPY